MSEIPLTFEAALEQLQTIVHELEEGELGLEASLARFEEGVRLLRTCYVILEQAEQKIEILTGADAAGNPVTAPFDATATFDAPDKPARKPARRRAAPRHEEAGPPEVAPAPAAPSPVEEVEEEETDGQRLF
jgi:exodeoxyribonuclease VII small subunit